MKHFVLHLFLATSVACLAQTSSKPAAPRATAKPASTSSAVKLPPGVPPVHGLVRTAFALHYQDIKIGTGKEAEANKIYKVKYTGWLGSTGRKFDSSEDHKSPVMGKDGKPELDEEGKPKVIAGEPISFVQGFGRVIPGFDNGFEGMKVGGKRRIFIPWQLAYGARGRLGPTPDSPGIPPKADLIFDVELVGVDEMPAPPAPHPGMGISPNGQPIRPIPHPSAPGAPATAPPAGTTPPPGGSTPSPNPAAPPPAGTPPPSTPQTVPPPDKPQSN